ncbi:hypothetical protein AJ79_07326 [Helicocarpus griseus UAMH5409]|uniref:Ubiquitin-like domain-containing protein n=1 Tax=Helicocarpus griseus UAMH5409 TaxID=1447875 RepID=A0A2B7X4B6_9EURO|nr:hypothetical protein AJ79_07326 [Helicocarpus griseus UAMH5409]
MAELTFTKSFLTALDSRPVKLPADYVFDPRSFPVPHPYTLPRLSDSHPSMPKKIKQTAIPGSSKSITVHLKSARNPVLHVTLDNRAISSTTVKELKEAVQERIQTTNESNEPVSVPLEKIKILWKKKPVQGQTMAEVLGNDPAALSGGKGVEFGVMILGGASLTPEPVLKAAAEEGRADREMPDVSAAAAPRQSTAQHPSASAQEVLSTGVFWDDLEDFVKSRVGDTAEASRIKSIFRDAWTSSR